jgi:hypothetical protein
VHQPGGRNVFAINPMAVSRYRDRHTVAGKKSDPANALVLAHWAGIRGVAGAGGADSGRGQAVMPVARALETIDEEPTEETLELAPELIHQITHPAHSTRP